MANNIKGNNKSSGCIIVIVVIIIIFSLIGSCNGHTGEDHNDGKCDICGKTATYSDGNEEYCEKHLEDAVEWYIEQDE